MVPFPSPRVATNVSGGIGVSSVLNVARCGPIITTVATPKELLNAVPGAIYQAGNKTTRCERVAFLPSRERTFEHCQIARCDVEQGERPCGMMEDTTMTVTSTTTSDTTTTTSTPSTTFTSTTTTTSTISHLHFTLTDYGGWTETSGIEIDLRI